MSDEPPPPKLPFKGSMDDGVSHAGLVSLPGLSASHCNLVPSADEGPDSSAAEGLLTHFKDLCVVVVGLGACQS